MFLHTEIGFEKIITRSLIYFYFIEDSCAHSGTSPPEELEDYGEIMEIITILNLFSTESAHTEINNSD